ncbi:leukocyte surface antigen CD53-like isoform X3 [Haliotis rufescens]|uniref:leukocyte surface antigen CD53-like isoform X3 n=1 Tax=Haliotis rufescens TaxID=6454 RepID=UPI00201EB144|nr:leukocyte surface antigen CD53-like isoform X3 [Haliotis rufescens]XP_048256423.1 leukocyte surface antigen CD53-like isoform X3 [Haliotis rufescens]XP_048256424.1 leukocyte surface antigen CD53-like isoform X3 [Haliotis rufescens]XP_048256425.1 leukocyte surface antigen CD53-like isoform X3 [Haliotis rufescens]
MTVETGRDGDPKSEETTLGSSPSRNNPSRDKGRSNPCLRGILFLYNICFLVLGCAAIVWGVLSLVTESNAINIKGEFRLFLDANELDYQLHRVSIYLLVVVGVVVVPLAILGFYGSIRENKCVLAYYGSILILVLIILCVMAGFSFSYKTSLSDSLASRIKSVMRDSLSELYGRDTQTIPENKLITEAWDSMQRQLGCCGISGNVSSADSWPYYSTRTLWYLQQYEEGNTVQKVPDSCCHGGDLAVCTGQTYFPGPPNHLNPHTERFKKTNPYLYTNVFGIITAFCLRARVGGTSSPGVVMCTDVSG